MMSFPQSLRSVTSVGLPAMALWVLLALDVTQAGEKTGTVEFFKAVAIDKPEAKATVGGKSRLLVPKKEHSFWVVSLTVPADLQKRIDPKKMTIKGASESISATGWVHATREKAKSFYVGVVAAGTKLAGKDMKVFAGKTYLHVLYEIPDSEAPAKFDWKEKAKPLVEQFK